MRTIIDLGCGVGNHATKYIGKYHIVGIDIDPENIRLCKSSLPNETWIVGDITNIPLDLYPDVAKIISTEVIEHVDDWKKVLANISTVSSGTKLLLTTPFHTSEKKLLRQRPEYWADIGHKHFFTGKEIRNELQKNGWRDIIIKRRNAALYFELRRLFKKNAPCIRNTYYENILSLPERIFWQLFRIDLFETKLKYLFPLWMLTIPIGYILDHFWGATIVVTAKK